MSNPKHNTSLQPMADSEKWDTLVKDYGGHPLQLWGWGEVKQQHGPWQAHRLWSKDLNGGAQVLVRKLPWPFKSLAYIPRGPVTTGDAGLVNSLLAELVQWVKARGCIELKIEPQWQEHAVLAQGFSRSNNDILLARTVILDLSKSTEELLAKATKKTRQYIRKSANDGVVVRELQTTNLEQAQMRQGSLGLRDSLDSEGLDIAGNIAQCLRIYSQTAKRAGFGIHVDEYYYDIARLMADNSRLFVAQLHGETVAFLWLVVTPALAFELYGGMNESGQQFRANYTLKWQVISQLKEEGVKLYDMNGLLNDGVSNFKLGFSGGEECQLAGTMDYHTSVLASVWEGLLPRVKSIVKRFR